MKTFKQYLQEGLSPILYHSTNFISAKDILTKNFFKLATDVGNSAESEFSNKNKYYFLSTTRHKLGGYSLSPYPNATMLVLDGKKLGQKYKGAPVDYWGSDFASVNRAKMEAEDRIYHTKPTIPKASSYILEIHVLLPDEVSSYDVKQSKNLRNLYKIALLKKIPIFFYYDRDQYQILNKLKTVKLDLKSMRVLEEPGDNSHYWTDRNPFQPWEELYYTPIESEKKLSKKAQKLLYTIKHGLQSYQVMEEVKHLRNYISNERSNIKLIDKIIGIFRKEKIKDPLDFIGVLIDKWGTFN